MPGFPQGGFSSRKVDLDPLYGLNDNSKPMRSRLLQIPSLQKIYLDHIKTIATDSLDWNKLGPVVARFRTLIQDEVKLDTRKLESYEAFLNTTADKVSEKANNSPNPRMNQEMPLRTFADERRQFLLKYGSKGNSNNLKKSDFDNSKKQDNKKATRPEE